MYGLLEVEIFKPKQQIFNLIKSRDKAIQYRIFLPKEFQPPFKVKSIDVGGSVERGQLLQGGRVQLQGMSIKQSSDGGYLIEGELSVQTKATNGRCGHLLAEVEVSYQKKKSIIQVPSWMCVGYYSRNKQDGILGLMKHHLLEESCSNHKNHMLISEFFNPCLSWLYSKTKRTSNRFLTAEETLILLQYCSAEKKLDLWKYLLNLISEKSLVSWLWDHNFIHLFLVPQDVSFVLRQSPSQSFLLRIDFHEKLLKLSYCDQLQVLHHCCFHDCDLRDNRIWKLVCLKNWLVFILPLNFSPLRKDLIHPPFQSFEPLTPYLSELPNYSFDPYSFETSGLWTQTFTPFSLEHLPHELLDLFNFVEDL